MAPVKPVQQDRAARRRALRSGPAADTPRTFTDADRRDGREARTVAIVMIVTMVLWLGGLFLGGHFGWAGRYAFLFDFAAIGGFVWSMVVTYRMWRRQASRATRN